MTNLRVLHNHKSRLACKLNNIPIKLTFKKKSVVVVRISLLTNMKCMYAGLMLILAAFDYLTCQTTYVRNHFEKEIVKGLILKVYKIESMQT